MEISVLAIDYIKSPVSVCVREKAIAINVQINVCTFHPYLRKFETILRCIDAIFQLTHLYLFPSTTDTISRLLLFSMKYLCTKILRL